MNENKENSNFKLPDSTIKSIRDAQNSYKLIADNLANMMPKIPDLELFKLELPKLYEREDLVIPKLINHNAIREENNWKRHKEILDVQNSLLGIQGELLKEQKSNTNMTKKVFVLTIISTIIAIISLIIIFL
jgi:hypothetical protein